jgi:hypothetical protein
MKLSKPHNQVIYDPVSKQALIIAFDEVITIPGRFQNYAEAFAASRAVIDRLSQQRTAS